jgi:CBS domain-containing protein
MGKSHLFESRISASFVYEHIHKDHPLHIALEHMGLSGLDLLPVVSRANIRHLEGILTLEDVLKAYGVNPSQSTKHRNLNSGGA